MANGHALGRPAHWATLALMGATVASFAAFLTSSTAIAAMPSTDTHTGPARDRTATQRALDALTHGAKAAPGALATVRDRHGTWSDTSGVADLGSRQPRHPTERFRAASVTKTFIATVLLQMAAEGKLSLDDTVEAWLPGLVRGKGNDGRLITLRQLLGHTSGLFSYNHAPALRAKLEGKPFLAHRFDTYTPVDLVRIALAHSPRFAPGTGWSYSNTNYIVLGLVIEKVTGRPLATEVERRLLTPLRLRSTSLPVNDPGIPGPHGRHYSRLLVEDSRVSVHDVTEIDPSVSGAAGALVTTNEDLSRFLGALLGGRLLPPEQMREMFTGVPMNTGTPGVRYGLGVLSWELSCGARVWGHDGRVHGSVTWLLGTPGGGHTLALNVNGDWGDQRARALDVAEAEFCGAGLD